MTRKRKERIDINYIKIKEFVKIIKNMVKDRNNIKYVIVSLCIVITIIILMLLNSVQHNESKLIINGIHILEVLEKDKIGVYIDGEVNNPGYIQIPKGKNLEYALNKVQGITKNADVDSINLKQILKNGEKIFISGIKTDTEESQVESEQIENEQSKSEKININSASLEELKTLDGIGDKTAEKIIEYRESNKFDDIEEIMEVKGIGEGKYEKIKRYICV